MYELLIRTESVTMRRCKMLAKRNVIIVTVVFAFLGLFVLYSSYRSGSQLSVDRSKYVNLKDLLSVALTAAQLGGEQVRLVRERAGTQNSSQSLHTKSKGKTKEGVNDVLTDGDLKSHRIMVSLLQQEFPTIKVISEEHDSLSPSVPNRDAPLVHPELKNAVLYDEFIPADSITVWIDPLDATKEYTENLVQYVTTMACVAVDGKPVMGVIYYPFKKKSYWGWKGKAVSDNLRNSKFNKLNEDFVVSISHSGSVEEFIHQGFPNVNVQKAAGAGYKSILVAERKVTAYVHVTAIKKWDVCAGHAILEAIGGKVTTLDGKELKYGAQDPPLNTKGLLATLHNHQRILMQLNSYKTPS